MDQYKDSLFVATKMKAAGMAGMLRNLKIPLEGKHHSGIDDCKNICKLVQALDSTYKVRWEQQSVSTQHNTN